MWRLLAGEVKDQLQVFVRSPALLMMVAGLLTATGAHVALGTGYPGPVAPEGVRWLLTLMILTAAIMLASTVPRAWSDVRGSLRRARITVVGVGLAGAFSVVKVGLHDTTPGPVMPAQGRWVAVALLALAALAWVRSGKTH